MQPRGVRVDLLLNDRLSELARAVEERLDHHHGQDRRDDERLATHLARNVMNQVDNSQ